MNHTQRRSHLRLLTFVVILLLTLSSCRREPRTTPGSAPDVLLMFAFSAEGKLLKEKTELTRIDTVLGQEAYRGNLESRSVVICGSGVGMTNAAMMTQKLIDQYQPSKVIFSGIAGALDTAVGIGDLVVCSTWVTHDFVYWGPDSIQRQTIWSFSPSEDSIRAFKSFDVDATLLVDARMLEDDSLTLSAVGTRTPQIHVGGVGVSGNAFVDNRDRRRWLTDHFDALITDMESAAVVQVCRANGVPCLVVRSASDLAGGSDSETAGAQVEQFFKVAASNSSVFVMGLLRGM